MCTVFNPVVGSFVFLDSSVGSQIPTGWTIQTDQAANPSQIDFLYNGVVRASVSIDSNHSFESGWPRWAPGGRFVAVAYGRLFPGGSRQHWVHIIDIRDPSNVPPHVIYGGEATTNDAIQSFVEMRATSDGEAFMCLIFTGGSTAKALQVFRTFAGNSIPICSYSDTSEPAVKNARITNDEKVEIFLRYPNNSQVVLSSCDLPRGELLCGNQPLNFPGVVIGGATGSESRTIDLFNIGNDCIDVNTITPAGPFTVSSLRHNSQPVTLPVDLPSGGSLQVEIRFQPTTFGHFENDLVIGRNPPRGCESITCVGDGVQGESFLSAVPAPLNFGIVPVGATSTPAPLTIRNTGNLPLNVQIAAQPTGDFTWLALPQTALQPNDSTTLNVTFAPSVAGLVSASIPATTDANNATGGIVLFGVQGTGCVPQAALSLTLPPSPFGQVEHGFRAVRTSMLRVVGNRAVNYSVGIENDTEGLFGLQEIGGSLTAPATSLGGTIRPPVICGAGASGTGEKTLAVVFWANGNPNGPNDPPRTAELVVRNQSQVPAVEVARVPLEASIMDTVAIDAALVLDRSGSMTHFTTDAPNQPGGDRRKVSACLSAAHLFVDLLRPEIADRLAVVRFNENPDVLRAMTLIAENVGGANPTKEQIKSLINDGANSLEPDGWTGLAGGVLVGVDEIARTRDDPLPNVRKTLVVLTDGEGNRAFLRDGTWFTVLGGASRTPEGNEIASVPLQIPGDIRLHAVGIGADEDIDRGQLARLSETTGGQYYVVDDLTGQQYFQVEKLFLQMFLETVDWASLSDPVFTAPIGAEHEHAFDLLKGDFGGIVVVFDDERGHRLPFQLISPKNELISLDNLPNGFSVRTGVSSSSRYIEFRCPVGEPERYAGQWKLLVWHPTLEGSAGTASGVHAKGPVKYGYAIGAGSNFRMQPYLTPGVVHVGDVIDLTALISEVGLPVSGCQVRVEANSPSGQTWEFDLPESSDGEYAAAFPHTAAGGSYQFLFRATGTSRDGEPVRREAMRSKYVQGRVPLTGDTKPRSDDDDCCRRQVRILTLCWRVLIGIAGLLVLILLLLLFR